MPATKTSMQIDQDIWEKWLIYAIKTKGKARKASELLAEALEEYMQNHPVE
jgi:hypothetical protein